VSDPAAGPFSRRTFLTIIGSAGIAASCSPRAARQKLVPFLAPPEELVPGKPLYYRTVCRECPAGCGVTARTREGRVTKLEGNPEDPIGRGALCARGQAAVQGLYAPDRLKGPLRRGADGRLAPVAWDEAEGILAAALTTAREAGPGAVRLLTRPEPGSVGAVQKAFLKALGAREEDRVVFDPLDPWPVRAASEALYGEAELPAYDLATARTVVSFGADFLETWRSPVELSRQFAAGRGRIGEERTRFAWIGPRLGLTGVSADTWLACRPGGERAVALGLLRWLVDPGSGVAGLAPEAAALWARLQSQAPEALAASAGVAWERIAALARELARRRPSALLGPGPAAQGADATDVAGAVALLNHVLGNVGRTVLHGLDAREDPATPFAGVRRLVEDLAKGAVKVLLVHRTDPVGTLPAALGAGKALERVPLVASFSDRPDATLALAHLVLPGHHTLEAFEDVVPRRGVVNLGQPAMTPLSDTRATVQVLFEVGARLPAAAAHFPSADPFEYSQARAEKHAPMVLGKPLDAALARDAAQRGGMWGEASPMAPSLRTAALGQFLDPPAAPPGALALVLYPTPLLREGGGAPVPWLQEVPDAMSTVSYSAWAELSPARARLLGVETGDVMAISTSAGRAELPAYVTPAIRDDAVGVPIGAAGVLGLLPAEAEARSGAQRFAGAPVTVARVGRRVSLPLLEGSPYQHGREIIRTVRAAAPALAHPDLSAIMYEPPAHPVHRWGMAIDLDRCTGCQACVVACYAENNVPVMGAEAARLGRYMAWLRMERYFGDEPGGALEVNLIPMLCQQCTNAPCESVCPVYATYHTPDGLNAQVYNRCVGTRYCSNNCPYKVRTFNWRDATFARPLDMQLNPDVTVRSRGVMEKCTFCVQRIRAAENDARGEQRPLLDGEIVPACAQTCPGQAITFGDLNDPGSRVSQAAGQKRGFAALEDLNTLPAITYLARVREPEEP
jgi:anaerobic selenocysteine-containing dehydrogenase/Fe-S-cluster-containing dehydrogenase component